MATLPRLVATSSAFAALAVFVGCAGGPGVIESAGSGPAAEAPTYRVGDRWVYHGSDGFRVKTEWDETHEVTAIGPEGITVRITQKGPAPVNATRTEIWSAPGQIRVGAAYENETRVFKVPFQRYNFPLASGKVWNQWDDTFNEATRESGQINRYVSVSGWDRVSTPAGAFDALKMNVQMRLDDETFWRWPTTCNYAVWYAPTAGAVVREERNAQYVEKSADSSGGAGTIRTQYGVLELVSFTPGR